MSCSDTATPRGLLSPDLRKRLEGYFGIRSRFQAAAWCKSTFFPPTYLLASSAIPIFFTAKVKRDALLLFLAYILIVYAKDIWVHLRRGQLGVLFRNRELRDHAFAEFYHAEREFERAFLSPPNHHCTDIPPSCIFLIRAPLPEKNPLMPCHSHL